MDKNSITLVIPFSRENYTLTSTISNGTVLLFTVPAIAVRLEANAWQDLNTAMHSGAKPVASSTHLYCP